MIPSHLHRHGVPGVLAPLATSTGAPYVLVGRFALALYPMLEARVGAEVGLSPAQWCGKVHTVPAPSRSCWRPRSGEAARRAAVEGLMDLFAPGKIVDLARASDAS